MPSAELAQFISMAASVALVSSVPALVQWICVAAQFRTAWYPGQSLTSCWHCEIELAVGCGSFGHGCERVLHDAPAEPELPEQATVPAPMAMNATTQASRYERRKWAMMPPLVRSS
jgi:hypothetical protein